MDIKAARPVDKKAIADFVAQMEQEVIPKIVEKIHQRQVAAARYRRDNPWM